MILIIYYGEMINSLGKGCIAYRGVVPNLQVDE
jgi:hypothetical protein